MTIQFPAANAPSEQQKWVRVVEASLRRAESDLASLKNRTEGQSSASNGKQSRIQTEVQRLTGVITDLRALVDYQASLVTVSVVGDRDYSTGDIPGDSTQRWSNDNRSTTLKINAPTGRLVLGFGCGQITVSAGNSSMIAYLRVALSAPSGYSETWGSNTRVFARNSQGFGVPVYSERTINVPSDETITATLEFGSWSGATNPTSNALFATPFLRAQVIPA